MESYAAESAYIADLETRSRLPQGFQAGCVSIDFVPEELETENPMRMHLSAIVLDSPSDSFAGVFTRNAFPGIPVIIGKKRLLSESVRGILINNKIANVCARDGNESAERLLSRFAGLCGCKVSELFTASTGVIGWCLPVEQMLEALPLLCGSLQSTSILEVSRGIMTTDSFPKIRSVEIGDGRIVGIAKGAGMIEPDMATLLVFILTDIDVEKDKLQRTLQAAVSDTFNCISVDGDQSTSDMALAFSSRIVPATSPSASRSDFESGLYDVCDLLAQDVVRNGEGTTHVIKVAVHAAPSKSVARALGKAIINSPLVKTAVYGDDPNVGRIVMAIGDFLGGAGDSLHPNTIKPEAVKLSIGRETVFEFGRFSLDRRKEEKIGEHMKEARLDPNKRGFPAHDRTVDIDVDLGAGSSESTVVGSDLSHEYVSENADYRT